MPGDDEHHRVEAGLLQARGVETGCVEASAELLVEDLVWRADFLEQLGACWWVAVIDIQALDRFEGRLGNLHGSFRTGLVALLARAAGRLLKPLGRRSSHLLDARMVGQYMNGQRLEQRDVPVGVQPVPLVVGEQPDRRAGRGRCFGRFHDEFQAGSRSFVELNEVPRVVG